MKYNMICLCAFRSRHKPTQYFAWNQKNSKIKELKTKMDMIKRNGTGMNMWCQSCGNKKKSMVGMICAKIGLQPGRMVDGENGALTEEDEVIVQSKSLRGVRI